VIQGPRSTISPTVWLSRGTGFISSSTTRTSIPGTGRPVLTRTLIELILRPAGHELLGEGGDHHRRGLGHAVAEVAEKPGIALSAFFFSPSGSAPPPDAEVPEAAEIVLLQVLNSMIMARMVGTTAVVVTFSVWINSQKPSTVNMPAAPSCVRRRRGRRALPRRGRERAG